MNNRDRLGNKLSERIRKVLYGQNLSDGDGTKLEFVVKELTAILTEEYNWLVEELIQVAFVTGEIEIKRLIRGGYNGQHKIWKTKTQEAQQRLIDHYSHE